MAWKTLNSQSGGFMNNLIGTFLPTKNTAANSAGKAQDIVLGNSPVEAIDPEDYIDKDPLKFNYVQYPIDLANYETGHYMIMMIRKSDFGTADNLDFQAAQRVGQTTDSSYGPSTFKNLRDNSNIDGSTLPPTSLENSILPSVATSTKDVGAIAIYMPPGIKVSYGQDYNLEDTSLTGALVRGGFSVTNAIKEGQTKEALNTALDTFKRAGVKYASELAGELVSTLGAGDPVKIFNKSVGIAINPHEELFYNKPNFRTFSYNFDFYPRSPEEVKKVEDIIFMLKYHSHPGLSNDKIGAYFQVPSEFEIYYMYTDKQNEHLNKISRCVLEQVDVSYGPEEQFSTFEPDRKGAAPVSYSVGLKFLEQQYLTKKQIFEGY